MDRTVVIRDTQNAERTVQTDAFSAYARLRELRTKGFDTSTLVIDNPNDLNLALYESDAPQPIIEFIERVEAKYGKRIQKLQVRRKNRAGSSGVTFQRTGRINLTLGWDVDDVRGVILHEFAHLLAPKDHHGMAFYLSCFTLFKEFIPADKLTKQVQREFAYKTSNARYVWAFMHGQIKAPEPVKKVTEMDLFAAMAKDMDI